MSGKQQFKIIFLKQRDGVDCTPAVHVHVHEPAAETFPTQVTAKIAISHEREQTGSIMVDVWVCEA
jgi:hypothetical protein